MADSTQTGTDNNAEVLFERHGQLGVVTLNRPRAVNALTAGMVGALLEQLIAWADDDGVAAVVIRGAGVQVATLWPFMRTCSPAVGRPRTSGKRSTG